MVPGEAEWTASFMSIVLSRSNGYLGDNCFKVHSDLEIAPRQVCFVVWVTRGEVGSGRREPLAVFTDAKSAQVL